MEIGTSNPKEVNFVRWRQFWSNLQAPEHPALDSAFSALESALLDDPTAELPGFDGFQEKLVLHLANTSPQSLLKLARIRRSLVLLESYPTEDVAVKVGYKSTGKFRSAFIDVTGYALGEYVKLREEIIKATETTLCLLPSGTQAPASIVEFNTKMLAMGRKLDEARSKSARDYSIFQDRLSGRTFKEISKRHGVSVQAVASCMERIERRYVRNESSAIQTIARLEEQLIEATEHNARLIEIVHENSLAIETIKNRKDERMAALQGAFMSLAVRSEVKGICLTRGEFDLAGGSGSPGELARLKSELHHVRQQLVDANDALRESEIERLDHKEEARKWRHNYTVAAYGTKA